MFWARGLGLQGAQGKLSADGILELLSASQALGKPRVALQRINPCFVETEQFLLLQGGIISTSLWQQKGESDPMTRTVFLQYVIILRC